MLFENKDFAFKKIKLSITTTAVGKSVYELLAQEDGLQVEYYYENEKYINGKLVCEKTSFHKTLLDLTWHQKINKVLSDNKIINWNGWHKTNSFVLDGGGFSFQLITQDDQIIAASGINITPENYGTVYNAIVDCCTIEQLQQAIVSFHHLDIKLPKAWINNVYVRYFCDFLNFFIKIEDQECTLLNLYFSNYDYYEGCQYIHLKERRWHSDVEYIFCAKGDLLEKSRNKMNNEQLEIVDNLDESIEDYFRKI